jgi:Flp pilus assembly pilin Flp
MEHVVTRFWAEDDGQDLVEYSLLLALLVVAAVAIFATSTQDMGGIWQHNEDKLNAANSFANPS